MFCCNYNLFILLPEKAAPKKRRNVFCQITQHLLENHEMWKKVIEEESQTKNQGAEMVHLNNVAEPILAIDEEEEDLSSRKEHVEGEQPEEEVDEPGWSQEEDYKPPVEQEDRNPQ